MEISWEKGENIPCEVGISAYAYDRVGLLQDMLAAISSTKTIINAASAKATKDGMANCNFTVVVYSKEQLNEIINTLQDVSGVIWASRTKAGG
jgi:GTP pyrophosphokinase